MKLQRSVESSASPAAVFAYLSDFTNTNEWDPGTVKTVKVSGDGGVGTTYTADFAFKVIGRFIAPLLAPALKKLGDDAEKGLREGLAKL